MLSYPGDPATASFHERLRTLEDLGQKLSLGEQPQKYLNDVGVIRDGVGSCDTESGSTPAKAGSQSVTAVETTTYTKPVGNVITRISLSENHGDNHAKTTHPNSERSLREGHENCVDNDGTDSWASDLFSCCDSEEPGDDIACPGLAEDEPEYLKMRAEYSEHLNRCRTRHNRHIGSTFHKKWMHSRSFLGEGSVPEPEHLLSLIHI